MSVCVYSIDAGIVDSARKSLFVYQPDKNWDTFYDPYFTPSYQPPFTSPDLETRAREICGDDRFCLFDIAATGMSELPLLKLPQSLNKFTCFCFQVDM